MILETENLLIRQLEKKMIRLYLKLWNARKFTGCIITVLLLLKKYRIIFNLY